MDRVVRRGIALVTLLSAPGIVEAGIPLYRNGSSLKLDLGIRVQLQYYHLGDEGWSEEKLYFRRLRPALEASFSPNWEAEAELDFGETIEGERVELKDVFVSYLGLAAHMKLVMTIRLTARATMAIQVRNRVNVWVELAVVRIASVGTRT